MWCCAALGPAHLYRKMYGGPDRIGHHRLLVYPRECAATSSLDAETGAQCRQVFAHAIAILQYDCAARPALNLIRLRRFWRQRRALRSTPSVSHPHISCDKPAAGFCGSSNMSAVYSLQMLQAWAIHPAADEAGHIQEEDRQVKSDKNLISIVENPAEIKVEGCQACRCRDISSKLKSLILPDAEAACERIGVVAGAAKRRQLAQLGDIAAADDDVFWLQRGRR